MLDHRAETTYQQGMEFLHRSQPREALPYLRAAIDLDGNGAGPGAAQARYLSYYGLCLAKMRTRIHEALKCCRLAVEMEPYRADMWWNLGRVAQKAGRRGEAYRALERAHAVDSSHAGIARDLRSLGVRRRPVLSFLAREHPLNVVLGRMR